MAVVAASTFSATSVRRRVAHARYVPCGPRFPRTQLTVLRFSPAHPQTSNGLSPLTADHVRLPRGIDPIAFPWDRHAECVSRNAGPAPDDLRVFSYTLPPPSSSAGGSRMLVHHVFTRNRTAAQAEPSALFTTLQTDIELPAERQPALGRGAIRAGPSAFRARFEAATVDAAEPYKAGAGPRQGQWPADTPACVLRARELMQRRARLGGGDGNGNGAGVDVSIDYIDVEAWRSKGNKKVSALCLAFSPLWADELRFIGVSGGSGAHSGRPVLLGCRRGDILLA